jgi:hypothetical protein
MRARLLACAVCAVLLPVVGAGTAMADTSGGQEIGQLALGQQTATANAESTQLKPTNQNVSVRVLSPGDDGTVTQSNSSAALAAAANKSTTGQSAQQAGAEAGQQAIGQLAGNKQSADADADSTQVKPTNRNISVRVLSPGDDGDVKQSNASLAGALAANRNATGQAAEQSGGGGGQTIGQAAGSKQDAEADATSKQVDPTNVNVPVRVLSPGHGGSVSQTNTSAALTAAVNQGETKQHATQSQGGACGCEDSHSPAKPKLSPSRGEDCGCERGGVAVQAIGQAASTDQSASAEATSAQIGAKNINAPVRLFGDGDGGSVKQSNDSAALAVAANKNATSQSAEQRLDDRCGCEGVAIQAIGQLAKTRQDADSDATSRQLKPTNANLGTSIPGKAVDGDRCGCDQADGPVSAPERSAQDGGGGDAGDELEPVAGDKAKRPSPGGGGGSVSQSNRSLALSAGLNANWTGQFARQMR